MRYSQIGQYEVVMNKDSALQMLIWKNLQFKKGMTQKKVICSECDNLSVRKPGSQYYYVHVLAQILNSLKAGRNGAGRMETSLLDMLFCVFC